MPKHANVQDLILGDIASGAIAFGARLTIEELVARYEVGSMPVREAVRMLQGAGVLEIGSGRSARVRRFDTAFVENLFAIRAALEVMLVRQAAQTITSSQIRTLEAIEDELEGRLEKHDFSGVLAQNRRFHDAIYAGAQNPEAVAIIDRHWWLLTALWARVEYGPERYGSVSSDHRHLLHALQNRDVDAAGTLMGAHVIKAKFDLLRRMATACHKSALRDAS